MTTPRKDMSLSRRTLRRLVIATTLAAGALVAPLTGSVSASADYCSIHFEVDRYNGCTTYPAELLTLIQEACILTDAVRPCSTLEDPDQGLPWYGLWHSVDPDEWYYCVSTPNEPPPQHDVCVVWADYAGNTPLFCNTDFLPPYQERVLYYYCIQDPLQP